MSRTRLSFAALLAALLAPAPPAAAQSWTGAVSTDWNTDANWVSGSGYPNSATADVLFGASGVGPVNISTNVQARSLGFLNSTGNYTLTSTANRTLSGLTGITVAAQVTGTQTIDLATVGTGSLLFASGGPLTITNFAPAVASPTLVIGPHTVIGTPGSGGVVVTGAGFTRISGSFAPNGTPDNRVIGGLSMSGPGRLELTGDNSNLTGGVTVTGGTLAINSDFALGASNQSLKLDLNSTTAGGLEFLPGGANLFRPVTLASPTRVISNGTDISAFFGPVSGAGQLVKAGSGTFVLATSGNTYTGGTTVTAGTLQAGTTNALPAGGAVTVTNGTLDLAGRSQSIGGLSFGSSLTANPTVDSSAPATLTLGGDITVAGGGGLTKAAVVTAAVNLGGATRTVAVQHVTSQAYDLVLSGPVTGTGGLTLAGPADGILALNAASTYTGKTTVSNGTLYATARNALPAGSAVVLSATGQLDTAAPSTENGVTAGSYDQTIGSLAGPFGAIVSVGGGSTLSVGADNTDTTFGGQLTGGGAVNKVGTGTLSLTYVNNTFGGLTVSNGRLSVGPASLGIGPVTVNPLGTLTYSGSTNTGQTFNLTTGTLEAVAGANLIWNGAAVGGGFLRGPGAFTLTGGTTLAGTTVLNTARVVQTGPASATNLTNNGTLSTSTTSPFTWTGGTNGSGGAFNVLGPVTVGEWTNYGVVTINSGGALAGAAGHGNIVLGGGSRTTVNAGGTITPAAGTVLELDGGLLVNNGTINGTTAVNFGSVAKGAGVYGLVNVADGGRFSPGNSPGTVASGSATWGAGGIYQWEVNDAASTAGTNWDLWTMSGALALTAGTTPNSRFTVEVTSLAADNSPGLALNFDPTQSYQWPIAHADGITGFDPAAVAVDTSHFVNPTNGGTFRLAVQGNDVVLGFTPVPEPGALALCGVAAVGWVTYWRRRWSADRAHC